jgi:hypothetical protein
MKLSRVTARSASLARKCVVSPNTFHVSVARFRNEIRRPSAKQHSAREQRRAKGVGGNDAHAASVSKPIRDAEGWGGARCGA